MEWESYPTTTMIEQAKEELQMLESHHPDRFDYLKLELKSFISQLQSQSQSLLLSKHTNNSSNTADFTPATSSTSTQESSTRNSKKRKKMGDSDTISKSVVNDDQGDIKFEACNKKSRDKDRNIDVVIAKAQVCLHKIKHFKPPFNLSTVCQQLGTAKNY